MISSPRGEDDPQAAWVADEGRALRGEALAVLAHRVQIALTNLSAADPRALRTQHYRFGTVPKMARGQPVAEGCRCVVLRTLRDGLMSVPVPAPDDAPPSRPADLGLTRAGPRPRYRRAVPLLDVRDLRIALPTERGPVEALRGVSFTLERGQTLGLIGESGCGKSMTALALIGLQPDAAAVSGEIRFDGEDLAAATEARWCRLRGAQIGMVFQEPMTALNPLHPVGRQIAEPLRLHRGLSAAAARAEALRLLERVQLPQATRRLDAYPHQLSGGQRQRVVIAIALACRPALLIADEPTTALDASVQREVLDLLSGLVRDDGMALLLVSHDLAMVADRVERLMVMYAGQVVEQGPAAAVFARPAHPYTHGLLAARPRLGLRRGTRLPTIPGRVPELHEMPAGCAFAERCARAEGDCRATAPVAAEAGPSRTVHCFHPHRDPPREEAP